jgi:hypothetical protein
MSTARKKRLPFLAAVVALGILWPHPSTFAQSSPAPSNVLPTGGGQGLIAPSDSVMLLLDHQAGLFQTVKDIGVVELRNSTIMLAKLATLMKIPVITTASEPKGSNAPLMPNIHQFAPHAVYVGRKGEVNAWDSEDFVRTVRATGRKTNAVLSEVHRTWNRPEAAELAKLYALVAPNYAAVIESFNKAQEVARQQGPPVR